MAGTGSTLVVEVVPTVAATQQGRRAAGEIALDHLAQGVRQHAEFGVDGDEADVIVADADGDGALGDGGVRLFGGCRPPGRGPCPWSASRGRRPGARAAMACMLLVEAVS